MNGAAAAGPAVAGNAEAVRALEDALAMARGGGVAAVAVVLVSGPGRVGVSAAGGLQTELYAGAGMLQRALMEAMTSRRSGLVVPRGLG
ncbi:MAG: hypothetical protein IT337_12455 [Thermomicrobiales bacterium]|nr:hypothetical protein [Thermomicrobiales bacterium]